MGFDLPPIMSDEPAVSVIMIFRDAEQFLAEAIESVLGQTLTAWELVLVDDGSTDDSANVAHRYAATCVDRIRYVQHPGGGNKGMSASRNLGIAETRASLIAFLDADDIWVSTKLDEQTRLLTAQPNADIVFGHTRVWYGWTGRHEDIERDYIRHSFETSSALIRPPFLLETQLLSPSWIFPSMSNIMLRRECLARVGAFEDAFKGAGEDTVFFTKVFLNCYAYYADSCWDWYRQHQNSSSASVKRQHEARQVNLAVLRWTKDYFDGARVKDPHVIAALDSNLRLALHPVLARLCPRYIKRKVRDWAVPWFR